MRRLADHLGVAPNALYTHVRGKDDLIGGRPGLTLTLAMVAVSLWPASGPTARPLPGEAGARLALVGGAALALVALAAVHWRRWRLGLDRMQLALVVACLLGAGALLSLEIGRPWHLPGGTTTPSCWPVSRRRSTPS
jgi:AcrR family transcriptional regulator